MTNTNSARYLFRQVVKGSNFVTPEVLMYGFLHGRRLIYELSKGRGFGGGLVYGVTVLERVGDEYERNSTDLSKCCHSRREVDVYLAELDGGEHV